MNKNWRAILMLLGASVLALAASAAPSISEAAARKELNKNALVIDVRTVGEFKAGHLTNAVNIPLADLKKTLPQRVPDKSQALLLHCQTGRRSAIAERELRAMGYTNAFNIGSFEQARKIVTGRPPPSD